MKATKEQVDEELMIIKLFASNYARDLFSLVTHFYTSLPTIVTDDVSLEQLNNAYRKETDADIKERILLVRRVRIDGQEASKIAERELHKSRWWAYKWLNRFDKRGLEGLKDQPRSGRASTNTRKKDVKDKTGDIRKPIWLAGQGNNGYHL